MLVTAILELDDPRDGALEVDSGANRQTPFEAEAPTAEKMNRPESVAIRELGLDRCDLVGAEPYGLPPHVRVDGGRLLVHADRVLTWLVRPTPTYGPPSPRGRYVLRVTFSLAVVGERLRMYLVREGPLISVRDRAPKHAGEPEPAERLGLSPIPARVPHGGLWIGEQ